MVRRAFTLTELLVIIAAVGILAAVLLPALRLQPVAQKPEDAMTQARRVGAAILLYANDFDKVFPTGAGKTWWGPTDSNWALDVKPYLAKGTSLLLHSDPRSKASWPSWLTEVPGAENISFVANGFMKFDGTRWGMYGIIGVNQSGWMGRGLTKESEVTQPHDTVLLTEAFGPNPIYGTSDFLTGVDWWDSSSGIGGLIPDPERTGTPYVVNKVVYTIDNRNGGINAVKNIQEQLPFVWVDGHAKNMCPIATNPRPGDGVLNRWDSTR